MRRRPDSRAGRLPRYAAELPWFGPILGREPDGRLNAGAASDPALGDAFAAVLVPARRTNGGLAADLHAAWFAPADCDPRGRFAVDVPAALERAPALLFALLYDLSGTLLRGGRAVEPGAVQMQRQLSDDSRRMGAGPVARLPGRMHEEIAERVGGLLERPARDLELALIELGHGAQDDAALTFAVASCQYPAGFLDRDVAERSYRRLARCLEEGEERPRGLLLLGDQVYVDATAGLFDPTARYDRYELPYERLLRLRGVRQVLRRLPLYAMLDDHEIEDNWEPAPDAATAERLRYGRRSYVRYQRLAGPCRPEARDAAAPLWYEFRLGRFPFFMADTRSERQPREARSIDAARIMGRTQRDALYAWLDRHAASDVPKFICSPSAFLPRHRRGALRSDTWHGYPASFEPLLRYIVDKRIRNVVFLSGDEHISFVARAFARRRDERPGVLVQSIHSSALYAPFTFANSLPEDLAGRDGFEFDGGRYACRLHTRFAPPGDGFTMVEVRHTGRRWTVDCRFYRGADPDAHRSPRRLLLAR